MILLGEMAAGIAHEVNNPLTVIAGRASLIRAQIDSGHADPEKMKEGLEKIDLTVIRIAKIVNGLKSFAQVTDSESLTVESVSKIIEDALDLCRERFKFKSIDLRVKYDTTASIACRPVQISQIIVNLLSNAYDAIELSNEKWVSLEASSDEKTVKISVTDSGPGIPREIANKIMQPFFSTKEIGKGTGLGLSISSGIAQAHHGQLKYDPLSKNTRFVLELPTHQIS